MSTQVGFYYLVLSPLEKALPVLVGKAVSAGHRVVVMTGSEERAADLDNLLWTFEPDSWIPHGTARDGDAEMQPVFITPGQDNPNGADLLVLTDGVEPESLGAFGRCLNLFDGKDEQAVVRARALWVKWRDEGHALTYYQQTERGGWQEKARTGSESQ